MICSSCTTEFFSDCVEGDDAVGTILMDVDEVTDFNISFSSDVTIDEGDVQQIELIGPMSIIEKIDTDSKYDNKELDLKVNGCSSFDNIEVNIVVSKIESINVSGDSNVKFLGKFNNVDDLKFGMSGSSKMDIDIGEAEQLDVDISGEAEVTIVGSSIDLNSTVSGFGKLKAFDLLSKKCSIDVSGDGDLEVNVENELVVKISGSANVCYKGNPTIDIDLSGSGKVENCN